MDIVAGQECSAAILCDNIMTEILVRLPPESIFMYRSVSKQWNSLLTSPEFLSHYASCFHHKQRIGSPPHRLLGFFLHTLFRPLKGPTMPFLSTLPRIGHLHGSKHGEIFSPDLGYFITSSNGLVLCGRHQRKSYHVLNPVTRKHVSLPPLNKNYLGLSIGLSCDDDGDDLTPRYEVVIADVPYNLYIKLGIKTYSSETKEWRESVLVGTSYFKIDAFYPPTVVNGVFYWWASWVLGCCLAAYDPHNKQRGNKDRNHVQLIELPTNPKCWQCCRVFNQTPDGRLICGTTYKGLTEIWELPERELGFWRSNTITKHEWVSIHVVSRQTLCPRNPFIRIEQREQSVIILHEEEMRSCETRLVLVDFIPWNSLLLMVRLGRSIFLYHMETQVLEHIVCLPEHIACLPEHLGKMLPFFEPTSFSSYLLA